MKSLEIMMLVAIGLAAQQGPPATPPIPPPAVQPAKIVPIPQKFLAEAQQLAMQQNMLKLQQENLELRIKLEVGMKDGRVDWQAMAVADPPKPSASPAKPEKK